MRQLFLILLLMACINEAAFAADFTLLRRHLLLTGEIKAGDAEMLASKLQETAQVNLYLNSLGGDVLEAMKMAQIIRGAQLTTMVAPQGYCASSCFFLYLAGYNKSAFAANDDGTLPQTFSALKSAGLEPNGGFVGIHRPYLKVNSGSEKQEEAMQKVGSYLVSNKVPQYLIDIMMSRPSNDIYWLSSKDFELLGGYNPGIEEELISRCGYKRISKQVSEGWSTDQINRLIKCESEYWAENIEPRGEIFIDKLRTGWRPWQTDDIQKGARPKSIPSEWVKVVLNDDENMTSYFDPSTVIKIKNQASIWVLFDFKTAKFVHGKPFMSIKAQDEYDCKKRERRGLVFSSFAGQMASGASVYFNNNASPWKTVPHGDPLEVILHKACGIK